MIILTLRNYCFSREGETRVLVGKPLESPSLPYISSKFNPLNTDTPSIQALSIASSLSVLRFDFTCKMQPSVYKLTASHKICYCRVLTPIITTPSKEAQRHTLQQKLPSQVQQFNLQTAYVKESSLCQLKRISTTSLRTAMEPLPCHSLLLFFHTTMKRHVLLVFFDFQAQ